jgi:hypothetical protein
MVVRSLPEEGNATSKDSSGNPMVFFGRQCSARECIVVQVVAGGQIWVARFGEVVQLLNVGDEEVVAKPGQS